MSKRSDRKEKKFVLRAVVAPSKKIVTITFGNKPIKQYRFQQDVPFKMVEKEFDGYDYGAWSVSDRDFTYTKIVKEWDQDVIKEIEIKALLHYNNGLSSI